MKRGDLIKLAVISLGCPKNIADTENLLAGLPAGFQLSNLEDSDMVLLNTCAFLKTARNEVMEYVKKLKDKKIVLLGCLAGQLNEDFLEKYPQVHAVISGRHYPMISEVLENVSRGGKIFAVSEEPKRFVEMNGKYQITPPSYAFIKIAEGCNNACSFCLIPKLKGQYRSRPTESILKEAEKLIRNGVKELVLVAQDCGMYGTDLYGKKTLADMLSKLTSIKGDYWIRILYIYPERIDEDLLKMMSGSKKICPYLDIPLQHGDSDVLKSMRRPYDLKRTFDKINLIRRYIPAITLRTSLIVGFPGESKEAFDNLKKFVKKINFDHVGVFEYSKEEGTDAHDLPKQLSAGVKKSRRAEIMKMQQKISYNINKSLVGKTFKTLIDAYDKENGVYLGRTMHFAPEIDGNVIIKSKFPLRLYEFYSVKITETGPYDLYGEAKI